MNLMAPFRFDALTHPGALVLLIAVAALFAAEVAARPYGALRISTGEVLERVRGGSKAILRHSPALLRAAGLALLVVALARPLTGMRPHSDRADVVDILLCVDVSGSMTEKDYVVAGERRDRLYVTKGAVRDFLETRRARGVGQGGRDRVGLLLYGSHAWTQCPLTLDYAVLERELDAVTIDSGSEKSRRTAIGSAIGLAVSRLSKSEAKSKVIILLTDGINNYGYLDPITAAGIAKDYGIRVYTIGAGAARAGQSTALGPLITGRGGPIDEDSLQRIAATTGAKYFRATDVESLHGAYKEIDALETTEVKIGDRYDYDEGFVPYAVAGSIAIALGLLSRRRWFEAIP